MTLPVLQNQWAGTASSGGASNKTIAISVSSTANRYLLIKAVCLNSTDFLASATCTVNGASAGSAVAVNAGSGSNHWQYFWAVVNPASGSYNVVVTPSGSAIFDVIVEEWTNVSQSTPLSGSPVSFVNTFSYSPVSVSISASGSQTISDLCSVKATGRTLTPAGTRIGSQINGVSGSVSASRTDGTATTDSWSFNTNPSAIALLAVVINSADGGGGGDTTPPTMSGSITVGTVTTSSIQISWPAGSDDTAVTAYEVSSNGGSSWTDIGNFLTYTFTGLSAGTSYSIKVRDKDAANNVAVTPLSVTQSTVAVGFDLNGATYEFRRENDGSLVTSTAVTFWVSNVSTGAAVAQITGYSTNASGIIASTVTHASLVASTQYRVAFEFATGEYGVAKLTAA